MGDFSAAINFVLKWEGEYSNDVGDPGGETIWGVSSAIWPAYAKPILALHKAGKKEESKQQALIFYKHEFWRNIQGDKLKHPLDVVLLDTCANLGLSRGVRLLQMECNKQLGGELKLDGRLGPKTYRSSLAVAPFYLAVGIISRRLELYARLPEATRNLFLGGWVRRCADLLSVVAQE